MVGERGRERDGAGPGAGAAGRSSREAALYPRSLQRRGPQGKYPQLNDGQPPLGRAARLGGRDSIGDEYRSTAGTELRPLDKGPQPRPGMREVESLGPQKLFDALQLAHLMDLSHDPHAAGALSRPGIRPAVQG